MRQTNTKHRFLDPAHILPYAGIDKGGTVADFGCGNGFFPVAAAKLVGEEGMVYAVDILSDALEATMSAAKQEGLKNIYTIRHNLEVPGLSLKENSCDAVILASVLHESKAPHNILKEAYRVLKSGGRTIIVEWKKEHLPFGPDLKTRIDEKTMNDLLAKSGFTFHSTMPADFFHYAIIFTK